MVSVLRGKALTVEEAAQASGQPIAVVRAVVAARVAPLAFGSDTGGSIRQPAALCGVVGVKPTYGRVSRYGLIAFASSLDHIGPFGKTVKDAAIMLRHIAGRDPLDSTSADVPVPDYVAGLAAPIAGLKIGVPREYFPPGLDAEVRSAVEAAIQKMGSLGYSTTSRCRLLTCLRTWNFMG